MKWDDYKTLSVEEKEYYNFHFKDKKFTINPLKSVELLIAWGFIASFLILVTAFALDKGVVLDRDYIFIAGRVTEAVCFLIIADLLIDVIFCFIDYHKEYKWFKSIKKKRGDSL